MACPPPPQTLKPNKTASVSIRATTAKKRNKRDLSYIHPLPKNMLSRINGFWLIFLFEMKDAPDHDIIDNKSKVLPHPFLEPYWGDIDDEKFIHLFNELSVDYSPIKLISNHVMFRDHDKVSFYLLHLIHIFTK